MPLPREAERRPDCVPSGTFTRGLAAVDGRHLELAAERRRHHRDRHAAMQVGAVALEERVRLERQENVEVARRPAAHARLALAGEADAGAVLDAGRHVDRERALARDAAGAGAVRARIVDDLAAALAGEQVRSIVKKPWVCARVPAPPQVGQVFGLEPGLAPVPEQASQVTEVGMRTCAVLPAIGLLERDLQVVAQVGAALAAAAAAAPPPPRSPKKSSKIRRSRGEIVAEAVRPPAPPCSKAAWPKRS